MKTPLTIAGICIVLMSCQKESVKPVTPLRVTYTVECTYCLVFVEDEQWNRTNHVEGRPDAVSQHFNVSGHWSYTFDVVKIDTASIRVYSGSFQPEQYMSAKITTSTGKSANLGLKMGVDNNEVFTELAIR